MNDNTIHDGFWADTALTANAKAIGAFVAHREDPTPIRMIIRNFPRETLLQVAKAIDELDRNQYVTRAENMLIANPDTLGGAA